MFYGIFFKNIVIKYKIPKFSTWVFYTLRTIDIFLLVCIVSQLLFRFKYYFWYKFFVLSLDLIKRKTD